MSSAGGSDPSGLWAIVEANAEPTAVQWLTSAVGELRTGPDRNRLRIAFARCGRMLGARRPDVAAAADLPAAVGPSWALRDYGRAIVVLEMLARLPPGDHVPVIDQLLRTGELAEQCSLLRMLMLLPQAERFVETAIEACRTNAEDVFSAIACENPFPSAYFPQPNFNQMVLKALFMSISVDRIVDLRNRVEAELVRMARAYADERRAAGRTVPHDITRIEQMMESSKS
jgi:hypothetical protein